MPQRRSGHVGRASGGYLFGNGVSAARLCRSQPLSGVVLGLSGGIDSAICAAIAADALGPDRVWCVMLPSRFTGQLSLDLAAECAKMIGCRLDTIPINPAVLAYDEMYGSFADKDVNITEISSRAFAA